MFSPFHVLLSIRLGLLLATIDLVLGQGSSEKFDILRGTGGVPACKLQETIVSNCQPSVSEQSVNPGAASNVSSTILNGNDTSPVPSRCSCTTIFFNIWSACCYSNTVNLPNLTTWTLKCANSSNVFYSSTKVSDLPVNLGIEVPPWATLTVPGNASFDLQRAVLRSIPPRWTHLQIILPVVTGVMTLMISIVAFLIYKHRFSRGGNRMGWPKGIKRLHLRTSTSHHVTTTFDTSRSWEIDQDPAFVGENIFHGIIYPEPTDVHEPDQNPRILQHSNSKHENPSMRTNPFRMPRPSSVRLQRPWKRRPPQIKFVPATPRFTVDDVDKSACTCPGESEEGRNKFGQISEVDEEEPMDEFDLYISPEDEETTNLITPSENDVILISKDGRTFTVGSRSTNTTSVNSHIKVESPSVSSTSPRSSSHTVPTKPALHIPIPPPLPTHAAPTPPTTMLRRALERARPPGSNKEQSLLHSVPYSFLSPIREASPSPSNSSSTVSLRRSPALIRRSSNSDSVYSQRTTPPARTPPNLVASSGGMPPDYFAPRRTASQTSDISLARDIENGAAIYEPFLDISAAAANGRNHWLSADDDSDVSFYCTSPELIQSQTQRIVSPTSTDPSAFYPGPVRGAGYPRTTTS